MLNEISNLYSHILEKLHKRFEDIEVLNIDLNYKGDLGLFENKYLFITINNLEVLDYEELKTYIDNAYNALEDGGILLLHALNPENIKVSTNIFYELTDRKSLYPFKVLKSLVKDIGFVRNCMIRDEVNEYLQTKRYFDISDVIESVSKGYSLIAQKQGEDISFLDDIFSIKSGISLDEALSRFERRELNDKKHIDIFKDKISIYDESIEDLTKNNLKIQKLENENTNLKKIILKNEKSIKNLENKLNNSNEEINWLKEITLQNKDEIKLLNHKIEISNDDINRLKETIFKINNERSSLEGELKILNIKLNQMEEQNSKFYNFVNELATDHHGLSNAVHNLSNSHNKLSIDYHNLSDSYHGLSNAFHLVYMEVEKMKNGCFLFKKCIKNLIGKFFNRDKDEKINNNSILEEDIKLELKDNSEDSANNSILEENINEIEPSSEDIKDSIKRPILRAKPILKGK